MALSKADRPLKVLLPRNFAAHGIPMACGNLVKPKAHSAGGARIYCTTKLECNNSDLVSALAPVRLNGLAYRLFDEHKLARMAEARFLRNVRAGDIAYIWPPTSAATVETLARRDDVFLAVEMINCCEEFRARVLGTEYDRLGLAHDAGASREAAQAEKQILNAVQAVFSPSPEVTRSLRETGVEPSRIVETSYGLTRGEILDGSPSGFGSDREKPTVIFVGRPGVRKGFHLLLDYWDAAGCDATLKIVGVVEEQLKDLADKYRGREDVEFVGFVRNLESVYRHADLFILPSLEEGSPLVTYIALGAGLPSLVTPMGGGGIVRDGVDGHVLDPHDKEAWVSHLRTLVADHDRRQSLGRNAAARAEYYLWENVAERRWRALDEMLEKGAA